MQTIILNVEGMSCEACVKHVTQALLNLEGVQSAEVSLPNKKAKVVYDPALVTPDQMVQAIEDEGYEATVA